MNFFEGMDIQVNGLSFMNVGAANAASSYSSIILIVLMIALMYFFMIRPQQKQRKQHHMMSQLHKGDEVVTIGRMHGKIDSINREDKTVTLDCEGIYLTFDMVAIARVVKSADQTAADDEASDSDSATNDSNNSEKDNDNSEK